MQLLSILYVGQLMQCIPSSSKLDPGGWFFPTLDFFCQFFNLEAALQSDQLKMGLWACYDDVLMTIIIIIVIVI